MDNKKLFKETILKEYDEEKENKEEIADNFVESLKQCEDEIVGSESVGETVEFFDEDGAILLLVTLDETTNNAEFEFVLSEETYTLSISEIPEGIFGVEEDEEVEVEA